MTTLKMQLKKKKQSSLLDCFDPVKGREADNAIAAFFPRSSTPYRAVSSVSFLRMVDALKSVPPSYRPPDRKALGGPLLDNCYDAHMLIRKENFKKAFELGHKATIITDGATISKRPLSNVLSHVPTVGPNLINYDMIKDCPIDNNCAFCLTPSKK